MKICERNLKKKKVYVQSYKLIEEFHYETDELIELILKFYKLVVYTINQYINTYTLHKCGCVSQASKHPFFYLDFQFFFRFFKIERERVGELLVMKKKKPIMGMQKKTWG